MLSLSNKYLIISFFGFAITILCIFKINNVHELRSLNTSLDNEKSKITFVPRIKIKEVNNG